MTAPITPIDAATAARALQAMVLADGPAIPAQPMLGVAPPPDTAAMRDARGWRALAEHAAQLAADACPSTWPDHARIIAMADWVADRLMAALLARDDRATLIDTVDRWIAPRAHLARLNLALHDRAQAEGRKAA